ncbi:hypothetical protein ABEB36_010052 [Hypothenemus hampei]|uniref:Uncharacterized protein n=1 Tax=Hypothenemus hampei TaxID=57062 RepID=A0ABD1EIE4_HYPHA
MDSISFLLDLHDAFPVPFNKYLRFYISPTNFFISTYFQLFSRRTWIPWKSRKRPRRAVLKNGYKNVHRKKMGVIRRWRYLQDIFTTLLDCQWRFTLGFLALEFFGCWLIFALIWWLIAFVHGDLHDDHLPGRQEETGWTPCILNIHGFHSAFLYSLETQHTTGYGLRAITEECPEAIFILVCQCLIGMTLDSFTISIVFAKMIRAKHATNTVQFSKNAVLAHRDGKLCFMFRIGDLRMSRLAGVGVRAILVKTEQTQEGEILPNFQTELSLEADGGPSDLFYLWPLIMYHEIDTDSPLHDLTAPESMKNTKIEIIIVFDATVESTGVSIEAKSSYLSSEILWGYIFEPIVSFDVPANRYVIDWGKFDKTRPIDLEQIGEDDEEECDDPEKRLISKREDAEDSDGPIEELEDESLQPFPVESLIEDAKIDEDRFSCYEEPNIIGKIFSSHLSYENESMDHPDCTRIKSHSLPIAIV